MSGGKSVRKGKVDERATGAVLRPLFPAIERNLDQARNGGRDFIGTPGYCIENKAHKIANAKKALAQAIAAAVDGEVPFAVTKDDRKPKLVTIRLSDFLPILQRSLAYENSTAIELVVGTEEDEAEAENALGLTNEPARVAS